MTHNNTTATTNRRILATPSSASNPKIPSMDSNSTHKKYTPELTKLFSSLNSNHRFHTTTKDQTHKQHQAKAMSVSAMADPDVQTRKKPSKKHSKHNDSKGSKVPQEIVKLHCPVEEKEEKEEVKRLSSGAIVKIKELKLSCDEIEHDCSNNNTKKRASMDVQRRRSFCGSNNVELSDFLGSNGARIVSVDMPPFMQIHAVDCARKACDSLEKFTSKALALTLKKEFDETYGPAWHCIVGSSFGSFVTHSVGGFLYFSLDHKLYVLLFKTSVQKAD